MKTAYSILLAFVCLTADAQVVITGRVADVVGGYGLGRAQVILKSTGDTTLTNEYGDFIHHIGEEFEKIRSLEFANNALTWPESAPREIAIYRLDGSELMKDVSTESDYLFPPIARGLYLLHVDGFSGAFKLVSDGERVTSVDLNSTYHVNNTGIDTLIAIKDGYRHREIAIDYEGAHFEVSLLSEEDADIDYLTELIDPLTFDLLGGAPPRSNLGQVTTIKVIYDQKEDQIYYQNTTKYPYHYYFADQVLGYDRGHYHYNQTQYGPHPDRYLYMGSVNYYESQGHYVLQLVAANEMSCEELEMLYSKVKETSFIGEELLFNPVVHELSSCPNVEVITSEQLYEGQDYQALNLAENCGYLKLVKAEDLATTYLGRRDLVVLDAVPNDIPVVAGIITSEFQTPLSHINVLSNSRGTPNMALRSALSDSLIKELAGQLVYLNVSSNDFELRPATLEEASEFWSANEPQEPIYLEADYSEKNLISMTEADLSWVNRIGGKAANFAEISQLRDKWNRPIPVPEGDAFAIPFYYYRQHIIQNGLDLELEAMLEDERFLSDQSYRKQELERLRERIISAPVDLSLIESVDERIKHFDEFESFRFRSSTNAEDLEDFSGAGLYDSKSAKKDHETKTIERAIKKVWASLWNFRAFEEREYFKIDHLSCAMGILVHRSFPDEDANGVMITRNLYNDNQGYIINAQFGEESIVFPQPGVIHDQIMVIDGSLDPREDFMIEYLSRSNLRQSGSRTVMTDEEIKELAYYAEAIKRHYYYNLPHSCECSFKDFGVDIEFKVDSFDGARKVYVKQARLYKFAE